MSTHCFNIIYFSIVITNGKKLNVMKQTPASVNKTQALKLFTVSTSHQIWSICWELFNLLQCKLTVYQWINFQEKPFQNVKYATSISNIVHYEPSCQFIICLWCIALWLESHSFPSGKWIQISRNLTATKKKLTHWQEDIDHCIRSKCSTSTYMTVISYCTLTTHSCCSYLEIRTVS